MKIVIMIMIFWASPVLFAADDLYAFDNEQQMKQFQSLIKQYRCPKCQNQTIADSSAPLAKDLRDRVHQMIKAGKDDVAITTYLVDRYGDFVNYSPPVKPSTWFLWFAPIIIIILIFFIVFRRIKHNESHSEKMTTTSADHERIHSILKQYGQDES